MKKIKPLSLFLLLIPYMVFSQDVNNISNTRPVASQSLSASDASNSVDLFTGKLNYGVNLKTVSLAGIGIPVGLSYTTSGFKVQEIPGNTGLGWSLAAQIASNAFQGNIHSFGSALGYFGVGALSGVAALDAGPLAGAAILGAGNNLVSQISANGLGHINWGQVATSTALSVATSWAGGQI